MKNFGQFHKSATINKVTRHRLSLELSSVDAKGMGNGRSRRTNYCPDDEKNTMDEPNYPRHWLPPGSSFHVDLSLLDISRNTNEDPKASTLLENLRGGIWLSACTAESHLKMPATPPVDEAEAVRKRVSRFLRTKDKYLALGSMLFKSQYFHQIYNNIDSNSEGEKQTRSVVQLPTTKYKKPYIPLPSGWRDISNHSATEEDVLSFSISHQFPFAGSARIKHDLQSSVTKDSQTTFPIDSQAIRSTIPPPIVGLDIVVIEEYNPRLYSSNDEFLNVFRDSFSRNEWENGIEQTPPTKRLREFYVRWSMKEAYTKAIGVGMGLDFKSFEIKLEISNEEKCDSSVSSIWACISNEQKATSKGTEHVCFKGTIVFEN